MYLQAPREIVEYPALLVEALQTHEIPLELCETPYRDFAKVDELEVWLEVHPKRFRSDLSLRIWPCRAACDRVFGMLSKPGAVAVMDPNKRVHEIQEFLRVHRQLFEKADALCERVSTVLAEFEIVSIDSAVEAEIKFVMEQYGENAEIYRLIGSVREHQQGVANSVDASNFEDAANHRDKRDRLLDELYELCTA